ncbi:serine protease Do-like HtrB [Andreesenia angusta]|uniref:Serine protease Do-like HtrB n=1 Tax=Andreesenia angusta TaxID=39480 RepID=A0A1S1V5G3_9FIRM|nr:trypsin-like peptidase domain-containing protein [Andreesenia angusta]OHW61640.1 serine protease Do-like HtrB [Andreesenia angusta]
MNENWDENGKGKTRSYPSYVLVSVVSAILGALIFSVAFSLNTEKEPVQDTQQTQNTGNITINPSDDVTTVEAVAKKAMSSVVGITTTEVVQDLWSTQEVQGVGSGVVVSADGYILTNSHVISNGAAQNIKIMFMNGEEKEARAVWYDTLMDLAVVKVEAENLDVAHLGNSENVSIGQLAIAIGNPLGLEFERTVTSGIISGVDRSVSIDEFNKMEGLLQTDASINSGNSGGPLLNSKGEVVGINTLKISSGEGLGFALPINMAKPIVEEIVRTGEFREAYIGIEGIDVARYQKMTGRELGVKVGVLVAKVAADSPAELAGLRPEDVIVSIDGDGIESFKALRERLYRYKPGQEIRIGIVRSGQTRDLLVKLADVPK